MKRMVLHRHRGGGSVRRESGISLIEVLVALVILGVGLLGLARLQLSLLAGTAGTAAYDHAVRLANDQQELLRFERLAGALPVSGADERLVQGLTFRRTWTVFCSTTPCRAQVTVRWTDPAGGGAEAPRELGLTAMLPAPTMADQAWLIQSGPPSRENLP